MGTRYVTDSFTTASVAAFGSLNFSRTLTSNYIDIFKIEITPSVVGTTTQFKIFKNSTRLAGDVAYDSGAWAGAKFYDPVEDNVGVYAERNEGFVARYEDETEALSLWCTITNNHAAPRTYDVVITYAISAFEASQQATPQNIIANAYANGLDVVAMVTAGKNYMDLDEAEFRAKLIPEGDTLPASVDLRTAAEGGSFTHNGTTQLIITSIKADDAGALYQWTSSAAGTWYFAWKLQNGTGWSGWSDGNASPQFVTQRVDTNSTYDSAPPSSWQVNLERGPLPNSYVVRVTRPATQGNLILNWVAQIKDGSVGSWRELDDNAGAAVTNYDGSGANHEFDLDTLLLTTPGTWGSAAVGDLILIDVNGDGTWTLADCQWLLVKAIDGTDMTVVGKFRPLSSAHKTGNVYDQLRLKIVKPPWDWSTEGFLGGEVNAGCWCATPFDFVPDSFMFDRDTRDFVSPPIIVPSTVTQPEVRVWFENGFSRNNDSNNTSTDVVGGSGILSGYTWSSFTDPRYWTRAVGGVQATLSMLASGKLKMTTPLATGSSKHWQGGATLRAWVMPATDGQIIAQIGFSDVVFQDDGSHTNDSSILAIMYSLIGATIQGAGTDENLRGMAFQSDYTGGALKLKICMMELDAASTWDDVATGLVEIAMPGTPFTAELRLTIKESPAEKVVGLYSCEYQINAAGWNSLVLPNMKWVHGLSGIQGYKFHALMGLQNRMSGDYATLDSFAITKGLIVGEGI